jgi:DNA-binding NarL/FixJ family response regulator
VPDNKNIEITFSVFKNADALLQITSTRPVDLIILDLGTWFTIINNTSQNLWQTTDGVFASGSKVLLILLEADAHIIDQLVKMNVDAIISMSDSSAELKQAIEHVLNPEIQQKYISNYITNQLYVRKYEKLSKKEWEVIKMFSEGYSLLEIAEKRCRAISTVATQKMNAMKKLNLRNNGELIKYFYIHSLL